MRKAKSKSMPTMGHAGMQAACAKATGQRPPSQALLRAMEAAGILHPVRSDAGWRLYSQDDVDAFVRHFAQRPAIRRRHERAQARALAQSITGGDGGT